MMQKITYEDAAFSFAMLGMVTAMIAGFSYASWPSWYITLMVTGITGGLVSAVVVTPWVIMKVWNFIVELNK
jgi:membrane protein YdbS with pleckstrin-like domain